MATAAVDTDHSRIMSADARSLVLTRAMAVYVSEVKGNDSPRWTGREELAVDENLHEWVVTRRSDGTRLYTVRIRDARRYTIEVPEVSSGEKDLNVGFAPSSSKRDRSVVLRYVQAAAQGTPELPWNDAHVPLAGVSPAGLREALFGSGAHMEFSDPQASTCSLFRKTPVVCERLREFFLRTSLYNGRGDVLQKIIEECSLTWCLVEQGEVRSASCFSVHEDEQACLRLRLIAVDPRHAGRGWGFAGHNDTMHNLLLNAGFCRMRAHVTGAAWLSYVRAGWSGASPYERSAELLRWHIGGSSSWRRATTYIPQRRVDQWVESGEQKKHPLHHWSRWAPPMGLEPPEEQLWEFVDDRHNAVSPESVGCTSTLRHDAMELKVVVDNSLDNDVQRSSLYVRQTLMDLVTLRVPMGGQRPDAVRLVELHQVHKARKTIFPRPVTPQGLLGARLRRVPSSTAFQVLLRDGSLLTGQVFRGGGGSSSSTEDDDDESDSGAVAVRCRQLLLDLRPSGGDEAVWRTVEHAEFCESGGGKIRIFRADGEKRRLFGVLTPPSSDDLTCGIEVMCSASKSVGSGNVVLVVQGVRHIVGGVFNSKGAHLSPGKYKFRFTGEVNGVVTGKVGSSSVTLRQNPLECGDVLVSLPDGLGAVRPERVYDAKFELRYGGGGAAGGGEVTNTTIRGRWTGSELLEVSKGRFTLSPEQLDPSGAFQKFSAVLDADAWARCDVAVTEWCGRRVASLAASGWVCWWMDEPKQRLARASAYVVAETNTWNLCELCPNVGLSGVRILAGGEDDAVFCPGETGVYRVRFCLDEQRRTGGREVTVHNDAYHMTFSNDAELMVNLMDGQVQNTVAGEATRVPVDVVLPKTSHGVKRGFWKRETDPRSADDGPSQEVQCLVPGGPVRIIEAGNNGILDDQRLLDMRCDLSNGGGKRRLPSAGAEGSNKRHK